MEDELRQVDVEVGLRRWLRSFAGMDNCEYHGSSNPTWLWRLCGHEVDELVMDPSSTYALRQRVLTSRKFRFL
jgi:hypothetical protein